jgi:hypothetical protein
MEIDGDRLRLMDIEANSNKMEMYQMQSFGGIFQYSSIPLFQFFYSL